MDVFVCSLSEIVHFWDFLATSSSSSWQVHVKILKKLTKLKNIWRPFVKNVKTYVIPSWFVLSVLVGVGYTITRPKSSKDVAKKCQKMTIFIIFVQKILMNVCGSWNETAVTIKTTLNLNWYFQSENYKSTNLKERHNIIRPLRKANLKRSDVKSLGFNVSKHLWRTYYNKKKRNLGKC